VSRGPHTLRQGDAAQAIEAVSAGGVPVARVEVDRNSTGRADVCPRDAIRDQGLFPSEREIARRLSQEFQSWQALAVILERHGFPRIDPLMGGRYWPAVLAWWNRRYGLGNVEVSQPDGEENLNAL
jgi:hypothetical protein